MQMIKQNSQMTSRKIIRKVGILNGFAYYLSISLIDTGNFTLNSFEENSQKVKNYYLVTLKVICEKLLLTSQLLVQKKTEFKTLKDETNQLEQNFAINNTNRFWLNK